MVRWFGVEIITFQPEKDAASISTIAPGLNRKIAFQRSAIKSQESAVGRDPFGVLIPNIQTTACARLDAGLCMSTNHSSLAGWMSAGPFLQLLSPSLNG